MKRKRALAAVLRFEKYGYRHHSLPDWDPPAAWAWKETGDGHNGKGVRQGVRDSNQTTIPCSAQLRPFREQSWYYRCAGHALRMLPRGKADSRAHVR